MQQRPTGVTILGVLEIISGVLGLIGGGCVGALSLIGFGAAAGVAGTDAAGAGAAAVAGGLIGVLGLVTVVLAIAAIAIGVGLLQLKPWAYNVARILAIINIVFNIISIVLALTNGQSVGSALVGNLLPILINGAVLYYLTQPNVKSAFGVA